MDGAVKARSRQAALRGGLVLALAFSVGPARAAPPPVAGVVLTGSVSLDPFRGLGAWIDIYDQSLWNDPEAAVIGLGAAGVRTLYLQTCNDGCPGPIHRPALVGRFIDAAHAGGMHVVAWYLPGLHNLGRDLARAVKAITFQSGTGQRFDAVAMDIESRAVGAVGLRNQRLLKLSQQIRARVGSSYALGAIVPPYFADWKPFPYRGLAGLYDVFLPMAYFTGYTDGPRAAHDEISRNVRSIRGGTGDPDIPIHVIAGIADDMSGSETRAAVHAGLELGVLGLSLYDADTSGPEDWSRLRAVPRPGPATAA